jgi:hypothetical protein
MTIEIRATRCKGKDLKPGDLFSTAGPEYWADFKSKQSIGERVYIRTHAPATPETGPEADVYRIEIVADQDAN